VSGEARCIPYALRREGYQLLRGPVTDERHLEVLGKVLAATTVDTVFVSAICLGCGRTLGELDFRARMGAAMLSAVRARTSSCSRTTS